MHQTTYKIYELNQALKIYDAKLKQLYKSTIVAGDFNISFSTINVSIKQKINKIWGT